jgi:hypothetical protein
LVGGGARRWCRLGFLDLHHIRGEHWPEKIPIFIPLFLWMIRVTFPIGPFTTSSIPLSIKHITVFISHVFDHKMRLRPFGTRTAHKWNIFHQFKLEYRVSHPPMSISGLREFREILLVQKLSVFHILSTHCTRLVQSLHPVAKEAFQGGLFNIP